MFMDNINELAAMLNEHEITDEKGQLTEGENSVEDSASQEENEIEATTEAEKPTDSELKEPKPEDEDDETQPVVDEEGKKYVPEKRFKEVYAKGKQAERKAKELEKRLKSVTSVPPVAGAPYRTPDKADALEVELLFNQYPQFNPDSPDYMEELDRMAAGIYQGGGVTTKLDAAKQALQLAGKLQNQVSSIKAEAKTIKRAASESIVSKGGQRKEAAVDVDKMGADELEAHLRSTGQWLP